MPINYRRVQFLLSAASPKQFPANGLPEIAIIGRSNVGKSSLLNALVERRAIAKVSKSPGRTQLINYFDIDEKFYLVDLPGYGFARVPDAVRNNWNRLIGDYLAQRETLAGVFLLLDIRRIPSKEDHAIFDWLESLEIPILVILTKIDKLGSNARLKQVKLIADKLNFNRKSAILTSALKRTGFDEIKKAIDDLLLGEQEDVSENSR